MYYIIIINGFFPLSGNHLVDNGHFPFVLKESGDSGNLWENFIEMDYIELMWWGLFIIHYQNHYVDPGNLWGRLYWYGLFWNLYYIKIFLRSGFTDKFSTYSNIWVYQIWYMYAIEGLGIEWKINFMFIFHKLYVYFPFHCPCSTSIITNVSRTEW